MYRTDRIRALRKRKGTKKINSIGYSGRVIGVGLVFLVPVSLALRGLELLLKNPVFHVLALGSLVLGAGIEALFFVHLMIELHQDRKIDRYCQAHGNIKIPLGNGCFECNRCGNRNVKESDTGCSVCGAHFARENFKTVEEILK